MAKLSVWRLAGLGLVFTSAAGVGSALIITGYFGWVYGLATYLATVAALTPLIVVGVHFCPPVDLDEAAVLGVTFPASAAAAEVVPEVHAIRSGRRLSDKITRAFEHACQIGDLTLAEKLLESLELLVLRDKPEGGERSLNLEAVIWGRQRLAEVRKNTHTRTVAASANETVESD